MMSGPLRRLAPTSLGGRSRRGAESSEDSWLSVRRGVHADHLDRLTGQEPTGVFPVNRDSPPTSAGELPGLEFRNAEVTGIAPGPT